MLPQIFKFIFRNMNSIFKCISVLIKSGLWHRMIFSWYRWLQVYIKVLLVKVIFKKFKQHIQLYSSQIPNFIKLSKRSLICWGIRSRLKFTICSIDLIDFYEINIWTTKLSTKTKSIGVDHKGCQHLRYGLDQTE